MGIFICLFGSIYLLHACMCVCVCFKVFYLIFSLRYVSPCERSLYFRLPHCARCLAVLWWIVISPVVNGGHSPTARLCGKSHLKAINFYLITFIRLFIYYLFYNFGFVLILFVFHLQQSYVAASQHTHTHSHTQHECIEIRYTEVLSKQTLLSLLKSCRVSLNPVFILIYL